MKAILLTGGSGFIGSHTCYQLMEHMFEIGDMEEYEIVIVDNLKNSTKENIEHVEERFQKKVFFYEIDLCNKEELESVFQNHSIESVIHFAGLKAVGESNEIPLLYYKNNLLSTFHLLECMEKYHTQNLIFSSSATVYGNPQYNPIDEKHPLQALNPYGNTKLMIEEILEDVWKTKKGMNIILLRYFNPISCHPSGILCENPLGRPNNLFPILSRVYQKIYPQISIFGDDYETKDGTGVRDYIHVCDLSEAHVLSLKYLLEEKKKNQWKVYNVGTGNGYSVKEMIDMFEKVSGEKIPYQIEPRRKGDSAICFANSEKIQREIGWRPKYQLEDMVTHEVNRLKKNI